MGEYFDWVNLDKKEYVYSNPWNCGPKLTENCFVGNEKTDAVLTLLSERWRGDRVVFMGDYAEFSDEVDPFRRAFEEELAGKGIQDYLFDDLTDITGIFSYVKSSPHCSYWDEDKETEMPYEGPFDTEIVFFRYVVDETLHEFVDRCLCPVRYIDEDGTIVRYDPVPELMSSYDYNEPEIDEFSGRWFGHAIRPTNERPPDDYKQIAQRRTCLYYLPIITADDESIRAAIKRGKINLDDLDTDKLLYELARLLKSESDEA